MTLTDLEVSLADESHARRALRSEQAAALLTGRFSTPRVPYVHSTTVGSTEIRLKFVDTVKQILNSKGKDVPGKESFLSYVEVSILPAGRKGFFFTLDVTQIVWAQGLSKAKVKHAEALAALTQFADSLGIDLSTPDAWHRVYSQNY